jgi:N6-adenosine-specific RNA methylase IME4
MPRMGQRSCLYRCIVADPPWPLKMAPTQSPGARKVSRPGKWNGGNTPRSEVVGTIPYKTMTLEEILSLKVPADRDCHLYLWTINKFVEESYRVARFWGFRPIQLLTWCKAPMGLGFGGAFCNTTEFVLFCRRGSLRAQRRVDTTWWRWSRHGHSVKPDEFFEIVESVSPGPRLEMFARRRRPGWDAFGDEVEGSIEIRGK